MRVVHCNGIRHNTETAVYIGRGTIFGNPFVMRGEETRASSIRWYKRLFETRLIQNPLFRLEITLLRGKDLACHCAPLPCHGDVILEWLETHDDDGQLIPPPTDSNGETPKR